MVRIIKKYLFLILTYPFFSGCAQNTLQQAGTASKIVGHDTATCLLSGPDSMMYYYGSSANMQEKKDGSIYDHVFMSYVFTSIKKHSKDTSFKVTITPISSADVVSNLVTVVNMFNTNGIRNCFVDTGYLPIADPLKLNLPAEESNDTLASTTKTWKSTVTILIYGNDNIYVYEDKNIAGGKKYDYNTIDNYLKNEIKTKGKGLGIIIKPNDQSTYKNTVDILDEMKLNNIEKYALVDITKEEEAFIKTLK